MECKLCKKEKPHYSLGMCKSCYKKHTIHNKPIINCPLCKKDKKLHLKGLCKTCYNKENRHKNNNIKTCKFCKQRRVIIDGLDLCKKCQQNNVNIIICSVCKENKPFFAKNMCKQCYTIMWSKSRMPRKCSCCLDVKIIHSSSNGIDLCINCYLHNKKEECSICGNMGLVNRREGTKPICSKCSEKYRSRKCSLCGEYSSIADCSKNICYNCYNKEYNSRIDVIAKKQEHCLKRRDSCAKFSAQSWLEIMNKFNWQCFYCNQKLTKGNRTLDHIIPISKGGKTIINNMIPCCISCNSRKNNKDPLLWIEKIGLETDKYNYIVGMVRKMEGVKNDR